MMHYPNYDCRAGRASVPETAGLSRRSLLGGAVAGFFGFASGHAALPLLASGAAMHAKARRMLVIWADGGPSQFETFDPKEGQGTSGPLKPIATPIKGLRISETLPELAKRMDKLSVVRNVTSREGEHERARYYLHTGYPLVEAFPRPALGSVMAKQAPESDLPKYVSLGSPGFGPAFLGADNGPFAVEDPAEARRLLRTLESRRERLRLTRQLSEAFSRRHAAGAETESRLAVLARIESLIETPFARTLDLATVSASERARYGDGAFADRAIVARRLLEIGAPFVEIHHGGWDTHQQNAENVSRLCREIDRPWAALMDDLSASGLLDETLVVWLGEFGRTPTINGTNGRDHFPTVTPVVLGGAGIPGGQVVGTTNADGTRIEGERYRVADLFATLMAGIGVKPENEFPTSFGSMTTATDGGRVIRELL